MSKKWDWEWNVDGYRHYKKKGRFVKLFWGFLLILMGIFLVISKMGLVTGISVWSVFFTAVFAALLIRGLIKRSFFSIFFSIAFLCMIYDDQLGITALTPWTVLLTALLLSIGMEILFHKKSFVKFYYNDDVDKTDSDGLDEGVHAGINLNADNDPIYGEKVYQSNNFATRSKYINPETFEKGRFENNFGSMNIFFENVPTQKTEGYLSIDNSFGEINIYVPSSWFVEVMVEDSFGSTSVKGRPDGSKVFLLRVRGNNAFGEVHVIYQ